MYLRKIFLSCAAMLLMPFCLHAQTAKAPSWVTTQPKPKGVLVGIASVSKLNSQEDSASSDALFRMLLPESEYKGKAREMALKKIMGSLHLAVSQESLFGKIRGREEFRNAHLDELLVSLYVSRIMDTPVVTRSGEWEDAENYWCYYSVKETEFNTYFKAFEDSVIVRTSDLWHTGLKHKENGEVYKAAVCFAQALDAITPLFYKEEKVVENGQEFDLLKAVYDSYMHAYDDMILTPSVNVIPAVLNEGVPVNFKVTASQNSVPLKNIAIYADANAVSLEVHKQTDSHGVSHFRVVNVVPADGKNRVVFSFDDKGLLDVPSTFASEQFRNRTFSESSVTFDFFNPQVSVCMNVTPADSSVVETLTTLLGTRDDMILADSPEDADLELKVSLSNSLENGTVSTGKYSVSQYSASCRVQMRALETDSVIMEYSVEDMKVMVPASRTEEKAARTAYREISRVLSRELARPVAEIDYDKRKINWSVFE